MNIMLVGAGRRYSFVERLKKAGFNVKAFELSNRVPISELCPIMIATGDWDTDRKTLSLLNYKVLPLTDAAAFELGDMKRVIGSPSSVAEVCYDKRKFETWMKQNFPLYYPDIASGENAEVIIKPRFGNSSNGILKTHSYQSMNSHTDKIAQRFISGTEYSVDTFFNKESECIGAIPRTRIRVAGGEVIDSQTVNNTILIETTAMIGSKLKIVGPACFQYIIDDTGSPYLFEINCRFGGGNILSLEAGFDMLSMIKHEYYKPQKLNPYYSNIHWGLLMRRVNRETFF